MSTKYKKTLWLMLSSFGIMFAVLSWIQETGFLPAGPGWMKGVLACFFGGLLYFFLPKHLD